MTRRLSTVLVLTSLAAPAHAQIPDLPTFGPDWVDVSFPKLYYSFRDGLTFGLFYAQMRPMGFADWEEPERWHGAVILDGQVSTSGRREIRLEGDFPKLTRGWRYGMTLSASFRPNERYFGLGNETEFVRDNVNDAQPNYYDAEETRYFVRGHIERRLVGGLRILAGFHAERWRVAPPDGPSVLLLDSAAGVDATIGVPRSDVSARIGLVFDTRDDESATRRGVLLEAMYGAADGSVLGDVSYTRTTVTAGGWTPLFGNLGLAARVVTQSMTGDPPIGSTSLVESSVRFVRGLGGAGSHRGLVDRRFRGEDLLLTNVELRYDILYYPRLIELTVIGWMDAGRVFQDEGYELTLDGLQVGGGGGVMLRLRRNAVLGLTLGTGPDGLVAQFHTRWTY